MTIKVDEKGRLTIPKGLRDETGLKEGRYVKIRIFEKGIFIEPLEPVADKYFGAFKVTKWPEELDEFTVKVMREWWTKKVT
ncbi:MAG: AbrB/MazE/SpoVT family DNA-binding domain-containing protein [Candidatus Bathyarchaeia archaeon]